MVPYLKPARQHSIKTERNFITVSIYRFQPHSMLTQLRVMWMRSTLTLYLIVDTYLNHQRDRCAHVSKSALNNEAWDDTR